MAENIEIKIEDLELSKFNPRFTFLDDMDMDIVNFIRKGNENYSEMEVAYKLLKNEGNLKDMINLMNSISNSGWIDLGEEIIVVESGTKYVVAEGNRRLLALKLLFKIIKLENSDEIVVENNIPNIHHDEELMQDSDFKSNYKEMINIIEKYDENSDPLLMRRKLNVKVVSKSDDLWTLLYTKHISGERPGMRQWKRGKYFVDILNFFPYGVNKKDKGLERKVSVMLRRDISAIFRDYIQAQFIRDMFESINKDLNKTKDDIKNSNVSALETTYSLKHIRNILKRELNYDNAQFKDMFDINYDIDSGIISYSGSINKKELFKLIIKYYKLGVLKTRPITDEKYDNIAKEVVQLFSGSNIDDNNEIDNDNLSKKDIFSFTVSQIGNLLINSPKLSDENKSRLKFAKKIIENDITINNKFKEGEKNLLDRTGNVFTYLNLQLKHNTAGIKKFTHAQALTLRTMMEQFFIWGIYFSPNNMELMYSDVIESNRKKEHIKRLCNSELRISAITRDSQKWLDANNVKEMLNGICVSVNDDLVRFFSTFYNKKWENKTNSKIVNGFIHAYHRFIGTKRENEMLFDIIEIQKNILLILENLNWDNINILDEEIKKYINQEKKNNEVN